MINDIAVWQIIAVILAWSLGLFTGILAMACVGKQRGK